MKFNSFGEVLYFFRKEMCFTQGELCNGICNRRTYMKWENNQLLPSFYHMECLSCKLNIDLFFYYKLFQYHKNSIFMHYDVLVKNLIKDRQFQSVKNLIPEMEQVEIRPPSFEQLIYLCRIICLIEEKNFELSIKYCLSSLSIGNPSPTPEHPYGRIFSNVGMSTLMCLAFSYSNNKMENEALEIYLTVFKLIDQRFMSDLHFYQSLEYEKEIYLYTLYSVSFIYKKREMYSQSLDFIQRALIFSKKEHCLYLLPELFHLKLEIDYLLGKYNDAYESYRYSLCLYQFQNKHSELENLKQSLDMRFYRLKKLEI